MVDGFETLDLLEKEAVGKNNRPLNDIKIKDVIIHANPIALMDYEEEIEESQQAKKEEAQVE